MPAVIAPSQILDIDRSRQCNTDRTSGREERNADRQLARRIAAGDGDAFDELAATHSKPVLAYLESRCRLGWQAEELLQDTLLQAWRQAHRFDWRRGSLRSWLIVIARSRWADQCRTLRASTDREQRAWIESGRPLGLQPIGTRELERRAGARSVRAALATLPENQRHCIELAFFDELTHRQVAERLQLPLGTVKSRILYGLRKLRVRIASLEARAA